MSNNEALKIIFTTRLNIRGYSMSYVVQVTSITLIISRLIKVVTIFFFFFENNFEMFI